MNNNYTQKYKMTKAVAKIRNKGDITIPISIRKQLNFEIGDHLKLIADKDSLIVKKLDL
jgi:AbrB family looped-hinge helix DNA binding protein